MGTKPMAGKRKQGPEAAIQSTILEYLTLRRVFHWRQNSGAFRNAHGDFYRFGVTGAPDIFCVIKGAIYGLEVKAPKGKLNPHQEEFRDGFAAAGGKYHIVRSLEDVQALGI